MKSIVILFVILVGVFCALTVEKQLVRDIFSQWKLAHGKSYKAGHEEEHRFSIFLRNYIAIQAYNQRNSGVTLALNQFADLTAEEFATTHTGFLPKHGNITNTSSFEMPNLPEKVDWRTKGAVTPVKNQLTCGSSWAFSAVGALEGLNFINHGELISFSEQNLVDCDPKSGGCKFGWMDFAYEYVAQQGIERSADYPYTGKTGKCAFEAAKAVKINSGYTVITPKSAVALKTALVSQPVSLAIQSSQLIFQFYKSGVITTGCGASVDHAVLAVGYETFNGTEAYIIKNFWGTIWGNNGYALIGTDESQNNGYGVCGILKNASIPITSRRYEIL